MRKKIALLHASNTKNYGSLMMVTNLIYYINLISKDKYDFYVDNEEFDGIERIKKETTLNNVYRLSDIGIFLCPKFKKNNKIDKIYRYVLHSFGINKKYNIANISTIIYLGGDDFSEDYSFKGLVLEFIKLFQLNRNNIKTILIGQTIGPFFSWRRYLATYSFDKSIIYTRDNISYEYLKDKLLFDKRKLFTMKDLALLKLPLQNKDNKDKILEKYHLVSNQYIVLVPSGIWKNYSNSLELYLQEWKKIVLSISLLTNKKIVLLAHVSKDTEIIEAIDQLLNKKEKLKIKKITDLLLPSQARVIIGQANFIVTGRMHASISAIQTTTPFIALSYSVKYKGVIGGLGLGSHIIEATPEKWGQSTLSTEVIEKVANLIDKKIEIKNSLAEINSSNKEDILMTIKKINTHLAS